METAMPEMPKQKHSAGGLGAWGSSMLMLQVSLSGLVMLGTSLCPALYSQQQSLVIGRDHVSNVISTKQFELLTRGKKFVLSTNIKQEKRQIVVPREWLVPPDEEQQEQSEDGPPVSSFVYDRQINSFPIGNGEFGLQFSSYTILPQGSMSYAGGLDVFLVYNPASNSLYPGLVSLGITKQRVWNEGCFHALMYHFVVGYANDDGLMDIGTVKEEIRCPDQENDWEGPVFLQHSMHWYVFKEEAWKRGENEATGDFVELPLIRMSSGPVDFAADISWHSYDPAKWNSYPRFTPSYRRHLVAEELQLRKSQPNGLRARPERPIASSSVKSQP